MIKEQKMSEGNSQVISCKKLHALVLPCILEEAESPLILMHHSLWELKAKKELSCLVLSCVRGDRVF